MTRSTAAIIKILDDFKPFSEDDVNYDNESFFDDITEELRVNADGSNAIPSVIELIERYPNVDFGSPGPLVHWLESYPEKYEAPLYDSIKRGPAPLTTWMLNRIINAERDKLHLITLLNLLVEIAEKEGVNQSAKDMAIRFLAYQNQKK